MTNRVCTLLASALVFASVAFSEAPVNQVARDSESEARKERTAQPKATANNPGSRNSAGNYYSVIYKNVTVPAGGSINLDPDNFADTTAMDWVSVTVRSTGADLGNLDLVSYWAVPYADYYDAGERVSGQNATFAYNNTGSAVFQVRGTQFRLRLVNRGASDMTLMQVTVYSRSVY